jgi:hypothetical protein
LLSVFSTLIFKLRSETKIHSLPFCYGNFTDGSINAKEINSKFKHNTEFNKRENLLSCMQDDLTYSLNDFYISPVSNLITQ